jgi:tight adherence protein C
VTAFLASMLAAVAAASLVGTLVLRSDGSLLAELGSASAPHPRRSVLAFVGAQPPSRWISVCQRTRRLLEAGGAILDEREVVGAKVLSSCVAVLIGVALGAGLLVAPLGALAFRLPDVWISRLAARRLAEADREVPVLLDLLAVATSAGLPPQLALRRAIDAAEGPLADELQAVVRATDLGGRWRDELALTARRLALPDLDRAVGALTRAEALGSSLAEEVERLAADVREVRRATVTERARAAPVKMLFPLVFLVLPAFLLLTVVPVLVATVESIR